jgi:hypothetical protein
MTLYDVKDVEQKSPIKKWMEIRNKKEIKK